VRFQLIRVRVNGQRFIAICYHLILAVIDECPLLHRAQLFPHGIKWLSLTGSEQIVDAAVIGISLALPGGAKAARQVVHFKDLAVVAIHLRVTACCQAGDSPTNNDDRFSFSHCSIVLRFFHDYIWNE